MDNIFIEDLTDKIRDYNEMSCKPSFSRLKTGHITDENMSVKWNREMVEQNNKEYEAVVKSLNTLKNEKREEIVNMCKDYIVQETKISKKKADAVYNYAYNTFNCSMREVVDQLDDLCELVNIIKGGIRNE